ncbi:hypothetical protein RFI_17787 [Reticulomyxa filosa]|uniref:Uncharacterized protein n=1 Tax=Reticulomyxa filosa TaxID=46433 RepID=X6N158_RETFI|nr:hypothetical protein RFI_17787 [Reticulomyxa filosa]|eukprot:ETO19444.1 hypothetical protein RFI_17787 [Reticulomyxa filosa]
MFSFDTPVYPNTTIKRPKNHPKDILSLLLSQQQQSQYTQSIKDHNQWKAAVQEMIKFVEQELHQYTMYPINTLRNIALSMCQSQFVFLVDVDFVPSFNLHDNVMSSVFFKQLFAPPHESDQIQMWDKVFFRKADNVALVIPAFEWNIPTEQQSQFTIPQALKTTLSFNPSNESILPKSPIDILQLLAMQWVRPFHVLRCIHWYLLCTFF